MQFQYQFITLRFSRKWHVRRQWQFVAFLVHTNEFQIPKRPLISHKHWHLKMTQIKWPQLSTKTITPGSWWLEGCVAVGAPWAMYDQISNLFLIRRTKSPKRRSRSPRRRSPSPHSRRHVSNTTITVTM